MQRLHLYVPTTDPRGEEIARHRRDAWQLHRQARRAHRRRALASVRQLLSPPRPAACGRPPLAGRPATD